MPAYPVPTGEPAPDDVAVESIDEKAGLYFRSWLIKRALVAVPQHEHDHDHATLVLSGRTRLWVDGIYSGEFGPSQAIEIKAGQRHIFQAMEPNTRLCCVHDIASAESVKRKGI